jgi:hypothetical protein
VVGGLVTVAVARRYQRQVNSSPRACALHCNLHKQYDSLDQFLEAQGSADHETS